MQENLTPAHHADAQEVAAAKQSRDPVRFMEAMEKLRMRKLGPQLEYCFANEFYGARMREAGISDPREIRTMEQFRALPAFMTKAAHRQSQTDSLEKYGHPYGLHLCTGVENLVHIAGTSGTTGLPTFYLFTRKDLALTYRTFGRMWQAAGIRPGDTILHLFGLSLWLGGLTVINAMEAYGCAPIPLGAEAGIAKALQYIRLTRPRVLFGTPSIISHLVDRCPDELGMPLSACGVEIIVAGGEAGLAIPTVRKRLQEGTGARLFDMVGGAWTNGALDCGHEHHNGLHYHAEDACFRYDLVDPVTRKPLPLVDGAEGEAIHTALEYEAAPALRYATGDMLRIQVGECPDCGFFGTRFGVVGRVDDLMNISGVKVYPNAVKSLVDEFIPEVTGHMEIVLDAPLPRVVPPVKLNAEAGAGTAESEWPALAARIEQRIHAALKIRAKVTIVAADVIPRSNLKTKLVRVATPG